MTLTEQSSVTANGASPNGQTDTLPVENPATGEVIAHVPKFSADDVAKAVERAREAQVGWQQLGFEGRAKVFKKAQRWMLDNAERVARQIVEETGKTYEDAYFAEVSYVASSFGFWAKNAPKFLADKRVRSHAPFVVGKKLVVQYEPVGVVGVIGPWNFPLTNSFGDCIPALAAGNAAVLKPSQQTPLTSLLMEEMLSDCGLPDGIFQNVTGSGSETGSALIDEADMIMFTGSTETGKRVMAQAAKTVTPVSLELGGKDPMIVLADADLERAANCATYYSMNNGGQVCISVERVYVEEAVYDQFVDKVVKKVGALRQGNPTGAGAVDIGAVIVASQVEEITQHVEDARSKGARICTGGKLKDGPGRYFEPTVIADADHSMLCMTEETFGPTLPIMKVRDANEAVKLANDSPYGLQASIFSKDIDRAQMLAKQIEAGVCCINDAQVNYTAFELPMGGWKESGLGMRHGAEGIKKYTRQRAVLANRFALKKDPFMFPYRKSVTNGLVRAIKTLYGGLPRRKK